ncbi:hypothetical protein EHQ12_07475 [Leptospira gomenensis]|uniref:Uncharacterized protein n=1 Tax=Leptospira gomenensis TaxID=2484974 RepID=A0A5F1YCD8_9LEPT|nr:hypothetical protein [Leptospira gomenensis]TGK35458.1 hypothetical protein EHQ17_05840 [Leptospira gomenensis]TGK40650.1 hypothetical protein EHQ12_07475 [Leptospira gomenensis]TGK46328.1 hypothetical protein EHQ07_06645 [Leptospira gomenensis]TGK66463.1 hypothetical protein EHQ13_03050 [Leptospira gomenensis]
MGKLTVRCPRCYESFLFDPELTPKQSSGRFDRDPRQENPYRKNVFEIFLENFRSSLGGLTERFRERGTLGEIPGKRLAKNLLLFLLAVGIVRACFYSPFPDWNDKPATERQNSETQKQPILPEENSEPSNPDEQIEPKPKFEI